jgi:hypothetical protein
MKILLYLFGIEVFDFEIRSPTDLSKIGSPDKDSFAHFGFHGERDTEPVYITEEEE